GGGGALRPLQLLGAQRRQQRGREDHQRGQQGEDGRQGRGRGDAAPQAAPVHVRRLAHQGRARGVAGRRGRRGACGRGVRGPGTALAARLADRRRLDRRLELAGGFVVLLDLVGRLLADGRGGRGRLLAHARRGRRRLLDARGADLARRGRRGHARVGDGGTGGRD